MIRFEDVIIKIGDFQLAANMTVPKGFTSVIGQSGAGKSTLMDIVLGLVEPTSGKFFVDGIEAVLRAMEDFSDSSQVQEHGCHILAVGAIKVKWTLPHGSKPVSWVCLAPQFQKNTAAPEEISATRRSFSWRGLAQILQAGATASIRESSRITFSLTGPKNKNNAGCQK